MWAEHSSGASAGVHRDDLRYSLLFLTVEKFSLLKEGLHFLPGKLFGSPPQLQGVRLRCDSLAQVIERRDRKFAVVFRTVIAR